MNNEQLFYIQDSRTYVGNSPTWWAKDNAGYTCDLQKAQLYTEEQALKKFEERTTDIPWKKQDVEVALRKIVDSQYLVKSNEDNFYSNLEKRIKEKKRY